MKKQRQTWLGEGKDEERGAAILISAERCTWRGRSTGRKELTPETHFVDYPHVFSVSCGLSKDTESEWSTAGCFFRWLQPVRLDAPEPWDVIGGDASSPAIRSRLWIKKDQDRERRQKKRESGRWPLCLIWWFLYAPHCYPVLGILGEILELERIEVLEKQ
jgi:hypothetical protein